MCDPVTIGIATAAIGVGQAVSSYVGQNQRAAANTKAANMNYAGQVGAINKQDAQLQQEHSEQSFDTALTQLKAKGDIAASAGDMGLSSGSLVSQVNAAMFGVGRQNAVEQTNFDNQRAQLASSKYNAAVARNNQIAQVPKASTASLVLGIGSAALQGDNAYNSATKAGS